MDKPLHHPPYTEYAVPKTKYGIAVAADHIGKQIAHTMSFHIPGRLSRVGLFYTQSKLNPNLMLQKQKPEYETKQQQQSSTFG
jgi:hypothetical protein